MNRLTCNLKNIKRPIRGLIPGKTIVRDELGVEIALRMYTRIKKDCNVFAVIDGKEYIIPTEAEFKKLLLRADNPVKEETIYEAPSGMVLPNILKKDENNNYVDTGKTVEEVYANHPVENEEELETIPTVESAEEPDTVDETYTESEEETVDGTDNKPQSNNRNRKNNKRR